MDPSQDLKNYLRARGLKPKDYLGQNFLINDEALEVIADAGDLKSTDTVLEVGPGLGALTRLLAQKAGRVVAVEKDQRLISVLKSEIKEFKNVELFNDDILRFNIPEHLGPEFKVVANIPYYLTSKLIANLLALARKPKLMVLLVQKEVAERIIAAPGHLSVLGISIQFFADAEIISHVPRHNFFPAPEVDSAIIRIEPKPKFEKLDEKLFFRIVKSAFAGKRKQIHNTLMHGLKLDKPALDAILAEAKIASTARPQELGLEDWVRLYTTISKSI